VHFLRFLNEGLRERAVLTGKATLGYGPACGPMRRLPHPSSSWRRGTGPRSRGSRELPTTMLNLTRERLLQLARFGSIGLLCACISIAVLVGLCEMAHMNYLLAFLIAFLFANICGYLLNGHFTFGTSNNLKHKSFMVYVLVNCASLAINTLALRILVEIFGVWYLTATIAIAIVNAPVNFIAHRALSYRVDAIG
jgi:putative flippase GtrA